MFKLHIALWQFLLGVLGVGALGVFAGRGRELKARLRRHLMERKHPRAQIVARQCPA